MRASPDLPPAYVHIGSAKAGSKSLQQHFFGAHPQLGHGGMGVGGPVGWVTPALQRRMEADLRCMKPLLYDPGPVAEAWAEAAEMLAGPDVRRVGLSYENLTLTHGLDVDITEKARRVCAMLGPDLKVVHVVREQRQTLRSGYGELLLNGHDQSFPDTIDDLLRTHVRSWISDLCHGRVAAMWAGLVGRENLHVIPFESLRERPRPVLDGLCAFLGVDPLACTLERENRGLDGVQLAALLMLNQQMRHDLSDRTVSVFQADRLGAHLDATWPELPATRRFANATLGRAAAAAIRDPRRLPALPPMVLGFRPDQDQMLQRLYAADNDRLAELMGWDSLPEGYVSLTRSG